MNTAMRDYVQRFRQLPTFADGANIFLNSAGSSLPDPRVIERMTTHLQLELERGGYEAATAAEAELEQFYERAGRLVGTSASNIAFADSGTKAWNAVVYAPIGLGPDTEIVSAISEFGSNLVSLVDLAHRTGATLRMAQVDAEGRIDLDHLLERVNRRTRLVAVSIANAHSGAINHLEGLAEAIRSRADEAIYLVDACQAVGQMPVQVRDLEPDFLTATGRKWLRGPRGTGFLYASDDAIARVHPLTLDQANGGLVTPGQFPHTALSVREDARRYETWERSFAAVLGLSEALAVIEELTIDEIHAEVARLGKRMRGRLVAIDGIEAHEPVEEPSGIVAVSTAAVAPWELTGKLAEAGISGGMMPRFEDPPAFEGPSLRSALRFSPHFFNTDAEVDAAVDALATVLNT